ncbi:MAG: Structural maintenance of chromosomes protein 5 [Piccolia ochrophora]|nr:MAG: Structural maintenance of chromosomes protein 5 [Piccolia ochrophora]
MPGAPLRRSRRTLADDDDEEDADRARSSLSGSYVSNDGKRQRLTPSDHGPSPSPGTVLPDSYRASQLVNSENAGADDGPEIHQPGSIVRVKLKDFVTYTSAEFFPGPSLNMIIGPNGTGKSTLVCAICLGLGWGPQHLGRAKDLSEFVKHGSAEATIEIELAMQPDIHRANPVIRRQIKREGNKSNFFVDDRPTSLKGVLELARSFSIQIDNLCQFLPQDKVCEFAALSPVELLHSTQRAVAPEHMLKWHEDLKQLRSKQKEVQVQQTTDKETLINLDGRQQMLRPDVERLNERTGIQERVKMLEMSRPFVRYRYIREKHSRARQRKKEAQAELKRLEKEVEPSLRSVNEKQTYATEVERALKERHKVVENQESEADGMVNRQSDLQESIEDIKKEIQAEKNAEKQRRLEAARLGGIVQRLQRQIQEASITDYDPAAYNERIREKQRSVRELQSKVADLKRDQGNLVRDGKERNERILQARQELDELNSQVGQQNTKLRNFSRETAQAWEWIRNHQDFFESRVYGPAMIECSVKDLKYVDLIESLFQRNDFVAFTVTSRTDFKRLSDQLHGEMNLADINIRTSTMNLAEYRPPVSENETRRFGFEGWALDYITGPDPVLAMLCNETRLNQTGVALRDITPQQFDDLQNSPVSSWVAGRTSSQIVRRREYGLSSTRVRDVRKGQVWTNQQVEVGGKIELQDNIQTWEVELEEIKKQVQEAKEQIEKWRQEATAIDDEKSEIERQKADQQRAQAAIKALPTRLTQEREKLAANHGAASDYKARFEALQEKIDGRTIEKARLALAYAKVVEKLQHSSDDVLFATMMHAEATSDLEVLTNRNRRVRDALVEKRRSVEGVVRECDETAAEAKRLVQQCQAIVNDDDTTEEQQQALRSIPETQTPEDLENEIEAEKARLELVHESNPNALVEYEQRQKTIDNLRDKIAIVEEQLTEVAALITETREHWEPELDRLVSKISAAFSHSFEKIGCAGQVKVHKDEDFDQWSIEIQVKFRENENLSILDSHRQSGGERAVSTIFYLMSLQSLARAPFRVVDEINQGMDPRNERMVHERMVDIACKEHTSQYFLITPKLLEGLKYHPRMRVHCIASGEYMPEEPAKLDVWALVERRRAITLAA